MAGYGVSGPFVIGATDEQFIVAEWHPSPEVIEQWLLKMANEFENWTEPLLKARQVMIEDTKRHFRTESDPDGDAWQELNPSYRASKLKAGFPDQILVRTGALQQAATSEEAWFIDERSIYFRESALPPYGPVHQEGTLEAGARFFGLQGEAIRKIQAGEMPSEAELGTLGSSGKGKNLPPRPFIGLSVEAENEIEAIFINHLWNTVEGPWYDDVLPGDNVRTTTGLWGTLTGVASFGGGQMVRGARGRFIGVHR